MEFFESSAYWFIALGRTLVHSLWIGLLCQAILKGTLLAVPVERSFLRYWLSFSMLILAAVTTACLFLVLYSPAAHGTVRIPVGTVGPEEPLLSLNLQNGDRSGSVTWLIISYIYLAGIAAYWIRSMVWAAGIRRLKNEAIQVSGEWADRFRTLLERLRIRKKVRFLLSCRITVPFLTGFIFPVIIVPAGLLSGLPPDQVETILMHELYHLRRRDYLFNLVQLILEGIFFFNPSISSISRTIRSERENCCDRLVLGSCSRPLEYARALVNLAAQEQQLTGLYLYASGTGKHQLMNRITRILNMKTMKNNIRERMHAIGLMAGCLLVLAGLTAFSSGFSILRQDTAIIPERELVSAPDTIPVPGIIKENTEAGREEIKREIEKARKQISEMDWEEIRGEIEKAQKEALEGIDWEAMKQEIEQARKEISEMDWEEIRGEIEQAQKEALDEINWEELKMEMEDARTRALEEIDWEELKRELEEAKTRALQELDEIDWEELKKEMERAGVQLDSMTLDLNFDGDFDFDFENAFDDFDFETAFDTAFNFDFETAFDTGFDTIFDFDFDRDFDFDFGFDLDQFRKENME